MVQEPKTKDEIARHLRELFGMTKGYTIGKDGLVTASETVMALPNISIPRLPIAFAEAHEDFIVSGLGLRDLSGTPRKVIGTFAANHNPGLSLEGAPEVVHGAVELHACGLRSLHGIPTNAFEYVVSDNELTSLDGISSDRPGISIDAIGNHLADLTGCPPNTIMLDVSNQKVPMRSLKGLPGGITYLALDDGSPMLLVLGTRIRDFGDRTQLKLEGPRTNHLLHGQIRSLLKDYHGQGYNGIVPMAARMLKLGLRAQARL